MIVDGIHTVSIFDDTSGSSTFGTVVQMDALDAENTRLPIREPVTRESPTGGGYLHGYRSEARFRFLSSDGSDADQLRQWMEDHTRVKLCAVGKSRCVQWYDAEHVSIRRLPGTGEYTRQGDIYEVTMRRESSRDDHDVWANANLLHGPVGWQDASGDGLADGYSIGGATQSFSFGLFYGYLLPLQRIIGDADVVAFRTDILFPVAGVDVTIRLENLQQSDVETFLGIDALDTSGASLANSVASVGAFADGAVTLTLPANTWHVRCAPVRNKTIPAGDELSFRNPGVHVDGETSYVKQ